MKLIADIKGHRQEFPLKEGVNIIGRDLSCDVTLPAKSISRRHVAVTVKGRHVFLRDLGSRNGIIIDGERVTEAEMEPGREIRFGKVPVRIARGATAATPAAAAGRPDTQGDILAPKAEGYHEDAEPTPVDADFAPDEHTGEPDGIPLTVQQAEASPDEENALARIEDDIDSAAPVPARPMDASPAKRPMSRREKILFFVPAAAVVLVVLSVLAVTLMQESEAPDGVMAAAQYNGYIARAVTLYREGDGEKALGLLEKLQQRRVQGDPMTAQMFADAVTLSKNLQDPEVFQQRWTDALAKWSEIEDYSRSTEELRQLGIEKQRWIHAESTSMSNYTTFLSLYKKGELHEALKAAGNVPADSIFSDLIEQQKDEVRQKLISEAAQLAQRHQQRGQWAAAITAYEEVEALADPVPKGIVQAKRQCEQNLADQRAIQRAQKLVDDAKYDQAEAVLDGVQPEGPYADEYKQLKGVIRTAEIRKNAVTLYNAKKADEALAVLKRAGLENDALYRKIEQVRDAWAKAQAAIKNNAFDAAKKQCQDIVRLESNKQNGYLFEAKQFLASAEERAAELAEEIRRAGVKAYEERNFHLAREKYMEAARMDPRGRAGREEIAALIKEAGREYNRAVNLIDKQPDKALEIFKEVKGRLRPGDPYYDAVDDRIRRMQD